MSISSFRWLFICFGGVGGKRLLIEMCISVLDRFEKGILPVLKCDAKRMYMCYLLFVADILWHR